LQLAHTNGENGCVQDTAVTLSHGNCSTWHPVKKFWLAHAPALPASVPPIVQHAVHLSRSDWENIVQPSNDFF